MNRIRHWLGLVLLAVLGGTGSAAQARPPLDQLLPDSTREFITSHDLPGALPAFYKTQFGRILLDNKMQPFAEDLGKQMAAAGPLDYLGLSLEEVTDLAAGEAGWAVVKMGPHLPGRVLLLDVTKQDADLKAKLENRLARWKKKGGSQHTRALSGLTITVQERLADGAGPAQLRAHVVKDNLLVIADNLALLQGILDRWAGNGDGSLARMANYRTLLQRTQPQEKEQAHVRFYWDPFGLAELDPPKPATGSSKPNTLEQLKRQGFAAIKAVGGFLSFGGERHDLLCRFSILAPEPYTKGMRMMHFLAGDNFTLEPWVPGRAREPGKKGDRGELATYTTYYWELLGAFNAFDSVFDAVVDDPGAFKEVVESLKNDPDGPQLDLRKDLVSHLTGRVSVLGDNLERPNKKIARQLFAFQTKNAEAVAQALFKFVEGDDKVKERKVQNQSIWVIPPRQSKKSKEKEKTKLPSTAVAVDRRPGRGYLFISDQVELVEKAMIHDPQRQKLADQKDYKQVQEELARLGGARGVTGQMFLRPAEDLRVAYTLTREDKLEGAESLYAQIILALLKGENGRVKPRTDLMPDFDEFCDIFTAAGGFTCSQPDGWDSVLFYLKPAKP